MFIHMISIPCPVPNPVVTAPPIFQPCRLRPEPNPTQVYEGNALLYVAAPSSPKVQLASLKIRVNQDSQGPPVKSAV